MTLTVLLSAALAYFAGEADARVPRGFGQGQLVGGLSRPPAMAVTPDGRIFIAQQAGLVRVVENGRLLPTTFAKATTYSWGERGLIGIALDPDFESNGPVYAYYTATRPRVQSWVAWFTASASPPRPGGRRQSSTSTTWASAPTTMAEPCSPARTAKLHVAVCGPPGPTAGRCVVS